MDERPQVIAPDDAEAPFGRDENGAAIAPYGLTQEGRPKKTPAGRPRSPDSRRSRRAAGKSSPPRRSSSSGGSGGSGGAKRKSAGPSYAEGIMGMMAGPMVALTIGGMRKPELLADAAAMEMHLPPIAEALGDLAAERPEVAAMLDRLLTAGPYTALISATVPLGLQVAANHGAVKPGSLGTVPPAVLLGGLAEQMGEQLGEQPGPVPDMATAAPGAA